jgi:hypothetical protein
MKTKMKRQGSTELPRFVVGALAAAGASAANATTVQISFPNNVVSSATGTTNFVGDLTGDGTMDVSPLVGDGLSAQLRPIGAGSAYARAGFLIGPMFSVALGGISYNASAPDVLLKRRLVSFSFSDGLIGVGTRSGWLDVSARGTLGLYEVQIHRLIFDDASPTAPTGLTWESTGIPEWTVAAVPEPGSNLALLALGAGGLTLRRRLKRMA